VNVPKANSAIGPFFGHRAAPATPVRPQFSLWEDGLPLDAAPAQGWFQFTPGEYAD
jgi:hypothetical protein